MQCSFMRVGLDLRLSFRTMAKRAVLVVLNTLARRSENAFNESGDNSIKQTIDS
jgi:hypothetical protein